jgi:FKBP-type peptidyl-prolyl cis-trans isomerase
LIAIGNLFNERRTGRAAFVMLPALVLIVIAGLACQPAEKKAAAPAEGEQAAAHDATHGHSDAASDPAAGSTPASGMGNGTEGQESAPASSPSTSLTPGANVTSTASGLKYEDLVVGTGATPKAGQTCSVHYTGWLTNGSKFDSSRDRGTPFTFPIGQGSVIKGWDEGVMGMKVGGKRKLWVPPALAYGPDGYPPVIPPNSELVFEVELLGVQ